MIPEEKDVAKLNGLQKYLFGGCGMYHSCNGAPYISTGKFVSKMQAVSMRRFICDCLPRLSILLNYEVSMKTALLLGCQIFSNIIFFFFFGKIKRGLAKLWVVKVAKITSQKRYNSNSAHLETYMVLKFGVSTSFFHQILNSIYTSFFSGGMQGGNTILQ